MIKGVLLKAAANVKDKILEKVRADKDKSKKYYLEGLSQFENKYYETAIELFNKSIEFDGSNSYALYKRAYCYYNIGDNYDDAILDLDRAIKINPKNADFISLRGRLYYLKYEDKQALHDIDKSIKLYKKSGNCDSYVYYIRAELYVSLGEYSKAENDYNMAIELDPDCHKYYLNKGLLFAKVGRDDEALKCFTISIEKNPNGKGYMERGRLNAKIGKFEHALLDLSKAIMNMPENSDAYKLRANIYEEVGDIHNALDDYKKATELDPDDKDLSDSILNIEKEIMTKSVSRVMNSLNELVGLSKVKEEVASLINFATVQRERQKRGLQSSKISHHLVFTGRPGTGKTTVARIIAEIYHHLGLLSGGHIVEADRSMLVAGYIGQTAIKVKNVIESARGGVLFIDEAYSLNHENDSYGEEAIETLLKYMEDYRDDLVVIVAGYEDKIKDFLKSNPGLFSRFNKFIHFEDYSTTEMVEIFKHNCRQSKYILSDCTIDDLMKIFTSMTNSIDDMFSNGRGVRNLFEKVVTRQADRIASKSNLNTEDLLTIIKEDIPSFDELELSI
ncbi:tetratricopeptide repeat protein [Geothermobacter hydrogeniphilus]|nr:tetratricopeptide repeat protein [Geothermobacter hydrogeniphilus]